MAITWSREEVMEALQKNLPAATVGVLQDEFKELERLRSVDKDLKVVKETLGNVIKELTLLQNKASALEAQERALATREAAVRKAEIEQEMTLLKVRLEEADKRSQIGQDMVRAVFQNRNIVESLTHHFPNGYAPVWGPNGQVAIPAPTGSTVLRTGE